MTISEREDSLEGSPPHPVAGRGRRSPHRCWPRPAAPVGSSSRCTAAATSPPSIPASGGRATPPPGGVPLIAARPRRPAVLRLGDNVHHSAAGQGAHQTFTVKRVIVGDDDPHLLVVEGFAHCSIVSHPARSDQIDLPANGPVMAADPTARSPGPARRPRRRSLRRSASWIMPSADAGLCRCGGGLQAATARTVSATLNASRRDTGRIKPWPRPRTAFPHRW